MVLRFGLTDRQRNLRVANRSQSFHDDNQEFRQVDVQERQTHSSITRQSRKWLKSQGQRPEEITCIVNLKLGRRDSIVASHRTPLPAGSRLRVHRKMILVALAVFVATGLVSSFLHYRSVQNVSKTAQWVSHTNQVRAEVYALESALKDTQRGVRGLIISHEPQSLRPYADGMKSAPEHFERLASLTSDNPRQVGRLTRMRPMLVDFLDLLRREVTQMQAGNTSYASRFVTAGTSNAQLDAISSILWEMLDEENQLLVGRQAATDRSVKFAITSFTIASVSALLLLAGIFAVILRQDRERRVYEDALASMGRKLIGAHEEERTRIARELHDNINQQIALLAVELKAGSKPAEMRAEASEQIDKAVRRLSGIGNDIQALSHRLHSSKLEILGLAAAAGSFCRELAEHQNVDIDVSCADLPRDIPQAVALCLFRVLQEALQNAVKHSGVRQFRVTLFQTPGEIHLSVSDLGAGFELQDALSGQGLGLVSMRERLQMANGELLIKSEPGYGTTVYATIPIPVREENYRVAAAV